MFIRNEEIMVYEVSAGGLGESILKGSDIIKSITIAEKTTEISRQYHLILTFAREILCPFSLFVMESN